MNGLVHGERSTTPPSVSSCYNGQPSESNRGHPIQDTPQGLLPINAMGACTFTIIPLLPRRRGNLRLPEGGSLQSDRSNRSIPSAGRTPDFFSGNGFYPFVANFCTGSVPAASHHSLLTRGASHTLLLLSQTYGDVSCDSSTKSAHINVLSNVPVAWQRSQRC